MQAYITIKIVNKRSGVGAKPGLWADFGLSFGPMWIKCSLVPRPFPPPVFERILQAIKNWRRERPGNEASQVPVDHALFHFGARGSRISYMITSLIGSALRLCSVSVRVLLYLPVCLPDRVLV